MDGGNVVPWSRTGTRSPHSSSARKTHSWRARTEQALTRGSDAAEGPPRQICQQKTQHLLSFENYMQKLLVAKELNFPEMWIVCEVSKFG